MLLMSNTPKYAEPVEIVSAFTACPFSTPTLAMPLEIPTVLIPAVARICAACNVCVETTPAATSAARSVLAVKLDAPRISAAPRFIATVPADTDTTEREDPKPCRKFRVPVDRVPVLAVFAYSAFVVAVCVVVAPATTVPAEIYEVDTDFAFAYFVVMMPLEMDWVEMEGPVLCVKYTDCVEIVDARRSWIVVSVKKSCPELRAGNESPLSELSVMELILTSAAYTWSSSGAQIRSRRATFCSV